MGDWEDFCSSNGKGMEWEPWEEPGWADDGKDDGYDNIDDNEDHIVEKLECNKSIIILSNLLERACTNKKDFTNTEVQAITYAISILSDKDKSDREAKDDNESIISGRGHQKNNAKRKLNEPPIDFDDDIPF